jgi:hypothetical protein
MPLIPNENFNFHQFLRINMAGVDKNYMLMTILHFSFHVTQTSPAETAQFIYTINITLLILHV